MRFQTSGIYPKADIYLLMATTYYAKFSFWLAVNL
jgi:hypothetical protein